MPGDPTLSITVASFRLLSRGVALFAARPNMALRRVTFGRCSGAHASAFNTISLCNGQHASISAAVFSSGLAARPDGEPAAKSGGGTPSLSAIARICSTTPLWATRRSRVNTWNATDPQLQMTTSVPQRSKSPPGAAFLPRMSNSGGACPSLHILSAAAKSSAVAMPRRGAGARNTAESNPAIRGRHVSPKTSKMFDGFKLRCTTCIS